MRREIKQQEILTCIKANGEAWHSGKGYSVLTWSQFWVMKKPHHDVG